MFLKKFLQINNFSTRATDSIYVTTPIFYVNASPHIGHLYSAVIADAIVRYQRLKNPQVESHFCTGTDEHGTKIQQAAANNKVVVGKYCDNISQSYRNVFQEARIQHTDFIRTTEERHKKAVRHFWNELKSRGHIHSSQYNGWYCVSDETFLTDSQLKINPDGSKCSLESGHPVEWTEETNYMFSLSKLQEDVIYWVKQGGRIRPAKFEKILLDYLNEPLPDVSISRPSNRVHWAIPVPDDDSQTVYVWLDALINYLTSAGYPNEMFRKKWPPTTQVIGKDILKFHGIYWPAFLIAAGLEPPQQLFVHSHWTVDGQKMSKSKFNVVDPMEASQIYTMEGLRYFLLREGVAHSDGNYSSTKALRILNSELADTLGNLLSRGCAKSLNPRQLYPRIYVHHCNEILRLDAARRLQEVLSELPEKCAQHYEENNFYLVVDKVMAALHATNNFFESSKPWELKKKPSSSPSEAITDNSASERSQKLDTILSMTMDSLRLCGIILQPIIPDMSSKLLDKLSVCPSQRTWQNLKQSFVVDVNSRLEDTLLADTNPVLFRRILLQDDKEKQQQQSAQQHQKQQLPKKSQQKRTNKAQ
ncbi:methionine--tRNA ligase, mitochondrial [Episyrphus balteatus]|uniref:methionine--tRNA ligase, mitochondrial n=1 Tax=Episyrphus balteatus TaxID=286459 RepID=UPI002485663D|nr:methionine--tRNA ligase, mitochondrial [Episyrphus balteatus]